MLQDDDGRQKSVVTISSMMGRTADRGFVAYGTAKAALAHWTKMAAQDLSPRIRVNGIYVGSIMTSALEFVAGEPAMMGQLEGKTPLGRVGEPEDIAAGVLYLSSKAGQYVTGKLIEIDGGIQQPTLDLGFPDVTVSGSVGSAGVTTPASRPRTPSRPTPASTGPRRVPGRWRRASTGSRCRCRWTA